MSTGAGFIVSLDNATRCSLVVHPVVTMRSLLRGVLVVCAILMLVACASLPSTKPLAPKVSVVSVVPMNLSLSKTKLNFTLRIANPNTFDLPIQTLDFVAFFAGDQIAKGNTNMAVTIPAKGETLVDVAVTAALSKLFGQLKSMFEDQEFDLKYSVTGNVKLQNWPTRIPFDVEGELEQPTLDNDNS